MRSRELELLHEKADQRLPCLPFLLHFLWMLKLLCSNFRKIAAIILGVPIFTAKGMSERGTIAYEARYSINII